MQTLSNYEVLATLHEGANYNVYQARELSSQKEVVLKATKSQFPSAEEIANLRREMEFSQLVKDAGVIQTLNFNQDKTAYFLVQESIGGITLKSYIKRFKISVEKFLKIAIRLSETLSHIHEKGIIHKDIKPSNIIINSQTGEVKITDFSLSTRLPQETTSYTPTNAIGGTLSYISPEQTGRVNRSIDYRSDLYSLGATFYEMLSGHPPFNAKTPTEMLCKHLTESPIDVSKFNPEVPQVINQIIGKLMQKNAEDRYQSALGLKYDLERSLSLLQESKLKEGFKIGEADYSSRLQIVQKLYGRQKELKALLKAFWLSQKKTQVVWVSGSPGIGKTALVHEVHRPITERNGVFIEGKFDQYQSNIPYYGLGQALNRLCDYLLGESEEVLIRWRKEILVGLKGEGQVLIDIIPHLEAIIGEQAKLPQLSPKEAQQRLLNVFKRFLRVVCRRDHPVTLFLDDMQWADMSSLNLLEQLLGEGLSSPLLFIGSYRDNEVSSHHPLMSLLDELNKKNIFQERLHLDALSLTDICQMLHESLNRPVKEVEGLAKLIYKRTEGNPFFTKEFFKNLYVEGFLSFSFENKQWQWNLKEIDVKDFSESVVELLIQRIGRLSRETQECLQQASVLGNIFGLDLLAAISKKSSGQTLKALWQGIEEGLVRPVNRYYRLVESIMVIEEKVAGQKVGDSPSVFTFVHDRVQEAAYETIAEENRKILHLAVGRILKKRGTQEKKLYEIVSHYQKSGSLLENTKEKLELAEISLKAAQKASQASAFETALNYSNFGISLLKAKDWERCHNILWKLYFQKGANEFSLAKLVKSEETFRNLLKNCRSNKEKTELYRIYLNVLFQLNRNEELVANVKKALKTLGLNLPSRITYFHIFYQVLKFRVWLRGSPERLEALPAMKNKRVLNILEIIIHSIAALAQVELKTFFYLYFLGLNLVIKYGNCRYSGGFYFGGALTFLLFSRNFELTDKIAKVGLKVSEKFPDYFNLGLFTAGLGVSINHWKNPIADNLRYLKKSSAILQKVGMISFLAHTFLFARFINIVFTTKNLNDLVQENKEFYRVLESLGDKEQMLVQNYVLNFLLSIRGDTEPFTNPSLPFKLEAYEKDAAQSEKHIIQAQYYLFRAIDEYLNQEEVKALGYSKLCSKLTFEYMASLGEVLQRFFFLLAYFGANKKISFWDRVKLFHKQKFNFYLIKKFCKVNPENFKGIFLLVKAEKARIKNKKLKAIKLYDHSIKTNEENGWPIFIGLSYLCAAKFYSEKNFSILANAHFEKAYNIFKKWGAFGLCRQLKKRYSWEFKDERESLIEISSKSKRGLEKNIELPRDKNNKMWFEETFEKFKHSLTPESLTPFDFQTALKVSSSILTQRNEEKLVETVMGIVLENFGVDKVCVLFKKEQGLLLKARRSIGEVGKVFSKNPLSKKGELPNSAVNYVLRTRERVVVNDSSEEGRFGDPYLMKEVPRAFMLLPILYQQEILGILYLENKKVTDVFTKERQAFLELIVAQMAMALNNLRMYSDLKEFSEGLEKKVEERTRELSHLASRDILTGVYNRHYLIQLAEEEIRHSRLVGLPLCLMVVELDNFSEIDRSYGSEVGDRLLKLLGETLKGVLRKRDLVGRGRGETFLVVLPETKKEEANTLAEHLRQTMASRSLSEGKSFIKQTVSIGVTQMGSEGLSLGEVLKKVDQALVQAKDRGGNRVEFS